MRPAESGVAGPAFKPGSDDMIASYASAVIEIEIIVLVALHPQTEKAASRRPKPIFDVAGDQAAIETALRVLR
jgi:hypothetical protein